MLKNFIEKEKKYFRPILESAELICARDDLSKFRKETVTQRRMRISSEIFHKYCGIVQSGPFVNLRISEEQYWGHGDLASKIFGFYEQEVLAELTKIYSERSTCFIQFGAGDGYYVTGLLHAKKTQTALAFEQDPSGREIIKRSWDLNGKPGQLEVYGEATEKSIATINETTLRGSVILIDIEGAEFELLTQNLVSHLREATIIVEIHHWVDDFLVKYETFLQTISQFFTVKILRSANREIEDIDELRFLPDDNRYLLLSEGRPARQRFLRLDPKRGI